MDGSNYGIVAKKDNHAAVMQTGLSALDLAIRRGVGPAPPSRAPVRLPGLSTVPPSLIIYSNRVGVTPTRIVRASKQL
jgi:hypothetical protein